MAALAIYKAGPRPCHFRPGPTSGPATRPRSQKSKISTEKKFSMFNHDLLVTYESTQQNKDYYETMCHLCQVVCICVVWCWVAYDDWLQENTNILLVLYVLWTIGLIQINE